MWRQRLMMIEGEFGDPFLDQYNAEKSAGQIK